MSMLLCYCGFPKTNHPFRHQFSPDMTLFIQSDEEDKNKDCYVIDANQFPEKKVMERCQFPQCSAGRSLHGTIIKSHEYQPGDKTKRTISFYVKESFPCWKCSTPLSEHESVLDHKFTVKIVLVNGTNKDEVDLKSNSGCFDTKFDYVIELKNSPK